MTSPIVTLVLSHRGGHVADDPFVTIRDAYKKRRKDERNVGMGVQLATSGM